MKSRIALLAIALGGISIACNTTGENVADDVSDITGTYNLVSIDGNPIPYAPMHGGQRVPEVVSGSLTLRDGGAFVSSMQYASSPGKTTSRAFAGTYKADDGEYILKWQGAGKTLLTIDGNTLTMNNEGMLFVYEK